MRKLPLHQYDCGNQKGPVLTETGCLFFSSKSYSDDRGFFLETYKMSEFSALYRRFKQDTNLVFFPQDNISFSKKYVVRGLHMQNKNPQGKLIRVLNGSILDVALDMNPNSKTYGCFEVFLLSKIEQFLYIPPTHAHGFVAAEDTLFSYKCTNEYDPNDEVGINPLDEKFNFPWTEIKDEVIISPKDRALPFFVSN